MESKKKDNLGMGIEEHEVYKNFLNKLTELGFSIDNFIPYTRHSSFIPDGCSCLALEIMPDHVHIFVGAKPTNTPSKIVNQLKGNTSRQLRRIFNDLKFLGFKKHYGDGFASLWADGELL